MKTISNKLLKMSKPQLIDKILMYRNILGRYESNMMEYRDRIKHLERVVESYRLKSKQNESI